MKSLVYKRNANNLQREILKYFPKKYIFILFWGIMFFLCLTVFFQSIWLKSLTSMSGIFIFILVLPVLVITTYFQWVSRTIEYTLAKSKEELWKNTEWENYTIEVIVWKLSIIHRTILRLITSLHYTIIFLNNSGKDFLKEKIQKEIEYFYLYLKRLQEDTLSIIQKQTKSLEKTRFEVLKNIAWTTELNQVSLFQQQRLNRQIEQFEELKKRLVKM